MCDKDGLVLNDPVICKLSDTKYWLSIADSDIELWAKGAATMAGLDVQVTEPDVSPLAVQGPKSVPLMQEVTTLFKPSS